MWEPDSATSSAEFLSCGVGQILLLSSAEFLSSVWRSGVWREREIWECRVESIIVQRSASEQTPLSLCIWYSKLV